MRNVHFVFSDLEAELVDLESNSRNAARRTWHYRMGLSPIIGSLLISGVIGCSASPGSSGVTGGAQGIGGATTTVATGGTSAVGGTPANGGSPATGGTAHATGGNAPQGGVPATGGVAATGGKVGGTGGSPTGGVVGSGGSTSAGGAALTGGAKSTGGTAATGGAKATTGGSTSTGGSSAAAGTSSTATGGAATGGTAAGGGSSSTCGFKGVPTSANTTNFDAAAWYTSWKAKFYTDCGNGMARVANGQGSGNTVSEGIGYGMLMAVGNGDKTAFDALWAFYKAHVDVNGLMNWSVNNCTTQAPGSQDNFAATDGDEDAAMALVQADAKWSGYTADAKSLIGLIKKYETSQTTTPTYLRPGDAANNGGKGEGTVNPSYFAPGYWHVWATYTGDASWNQLATDSYAMLAKFQALSIPDPLNSNYTGGLVPDWGTSQGQNPNNNKYWYDACRTPWRVATDYVWFCTAEAQTFLQNVAAFVDSKGGIATYAPLLGPGGAGNSAFLGPFALSGTAVSQAKADTYLNAWLSANMDDTPYFQGSLRGVYLLLANRSFAKGI